MTDLLHRASLGPDPTLFAASVAAAVSLATALGLALARVLRRRPVPLRYGLLLAALCVAVLSPALTTVARRAKLGVVAVTPPAVTTVPSTADPTPAATPTAGDAPPLPPGGVARPALAPPPDATATALPAPPWWQVVGSLLCATWAAGTLVGFARLGLGVVRLRRFMLTLRPCDDAVARRLLDRSAAALGVRRPPRLCVSSALPVPMVMGLTRPAVVLPAGLAAEMDADRLEAVLLHEAAHVAHGDLWVGLFQRLAAALLWWCPLVHALNRRLSDLREEICDNYVLAAQGHGLTLAEVLVGFAERARGTRWAAAVGAMGVVDERPGLAGRIERLLSDERTAVTRMNRAAVLGTIGFALLAGGAVLATTVRAEEKPEPANPVPAKPAPVATAKDRLAAADFWDAFA
ncbi:MAG TPA: M56 family metallopeptidase, partial [Humisphaera sp.]